MIQPKLEGGSVRALHGSDGRFAMANGGMGSCVGFHGAIDGKRNPKAHVEDTQNSDYLRGQLRPRTLFKIRT